MCAKRMMPSASGKCRAPTMLNPTTKNVNAIIKRVTCHCV